LIDLRVVVDDDDCGAGLQKPVEHRDQCGDVQRMQAGRRLVKDVQDATLTGPQPRRDSQRLGIAAGPRWRRLARPQIAQADVVDRAKSCRDRATAAKAVQGFVHAQAEYVGDRDAVDLYSQCVVVEAGGVAGRARRPLWSRPVDKRWAVSETDPGRQAGRTAVRARFSTGRGELRMTEPADMPGPASDVTG
jgi:hypothetical protein